MKIFTFALALITAVQVSSCRQINGKDKKAENRPKAKTEQEWKKLLPENTYKIMVDGGTELPFNNAYWNNHQKGVYVSAATGDTLFSSDDKFDSGTGWPSFTQPTDRSKIEIKDDNSYGMVREEVIEKSTALHLGHVFDDGPADRGGKRYCINSGALKFIKE